VTIIADEDYSIDRSLLLALLYLLNVSHLQFAMFTTGCNQGRPVSVKHGARCTMGKVGGGQKPKEGEF